MPEKIIPVLKGIDGRNQMLENQLRRFIEDFN
jgi:hypothetical protein